MGKESDNGRVSGYRVTCARLGVAASLLRKLGHRYQIQGVISAQCSAA